MFAKGANYIPCDNFLTRVTDSIYEKTIRDAVSANMNMLRVWGGGVYEKDIFYDLCDKYGILIWQDFMFACIFIRLYDDFCLRAAYFLLKANCWKTFAGKPLIMYDACVTIVV